MDDLKYSRRLKPSSNKVGAASTRSWNENDRFPSKNKLFEMSALPTSCDTVPKSNQVMIPSAHAVDYVDDSRVFGHSSSRRLYEEFSYNDLYVLKELNCPMAEKKMIRSSIIREKGNIVSQSKWFAEFKVHWRRFKENSRDALHQAKLWESSLHEIEGRFGTGIRSYFAFLRWLFLLNVAICILIFFFIVIPTVVYENLRKSEVISNRTSERNISADCAYNPYNSNAINNFPQYILWWFTGQGFMEKTLLFFGYYDKVATLVRVDGVEFFYNIPLAYLIVAFTYFFISLILIVRKAAYGLRESLTTDDKFYAYCNQIFSGWDFCINDEAAAHLKHRNIKHEIEVELQEERLRERQAKRTKNEKLILYAKRFVINIVVLGVLISCLIAVFFAAQFALQNSSTYDETFLLDLLVTYLTSIIITVANFAAPVLFAALIKYEDYSPEFTIQFTLARTVVLRLASIVFLYVVVYFQINCNSYTSFVSTPFNPLCNYCVGLECWETYLGQEMYKLTVLDFFIVIAVTLLVEFPRKLFVEYSEFNFIKKHVQLQEFSIIKNVLSLTYSQTLIWIGAFYAPLLPVMVVIKLFVFFYIKKLTLLYNCQPASRPYRASRSGTFFYFILIFGFAVALFPVAISISIITPSVDCGPFRNWPSMFYAVTSSIMTLPAWAQAMFWFLGSSGFAALLILLLCLIVYYFYSTSSAHRLTIRLLKNQLILEGKDKQFLLKRMSEITDKYQNASGHDGMQDDGHEKYNKSIFPGVGHRPYV